MSSMTSVMDRAMTVGQLIEMLQNFDKDAVVVYQYPSGDYWRTELASCVQDVSECQVSWSEYHRQLQLEDNPDSEDDTANVVLIM